MCIRKFTIRNWQVYNAPVSSNAISPLHFIIYYALCITQTHSRITHVRSLYYEWKCGDVMRSVRINDTFESWIPFVSDYLIYIGQLVEEPITTNNKKQKSRNLSKYLITCMWRTGENGCDVCFQPNVSFKFHRISQ